MARNLDVIMDLAFVALKAGAEAATVIGLLQDVELPEHADELQQAEVPPAATTGDPSGITFDGSAWVPKPAKPE
ncbi:hypothetical protein FHR71_001750 [Methylobacterium sp. RAS18]|nr:hypothetical protein [Methylobacterium sp. RAS18]